MLKRGVISEIILMLLPPGGCNKNDPFCGIVCAVGARYLFG